MHHRAEPATVWRMFRHLTRTLGTALALLAVAAATPTAAHATAGGDRSAPYHLALGDSLPYGFTTAKATAGLPPSAFSGYPDPVSAWLHASRHRRITTVNYACPGESTTTFAAGPCGWRAAGFRLHDDYAGSQSAAAERFLRERSARRGTVTLTLWGNDVRQFLQSCPDTACVVERAPAEIAAFGVRLAQILTRLRAAAPHADIVVVGAYHVERVGAAVALADTLFAAFNDTIGRVAAATGARFANPMPVFNPAGSEAVRAAVLCRLTLICAENDSHPSRAGQLALAGTVIAALTG